MIPAMAMIASKTMMATAVAGRTPRSYASAAGFPHSVKILRDLSAKDLHRTVGRGCLTKMSRPPNGGGGPDYMKEGSPPWGGLGGYPFTPWTNVPLV